MRTGTCASFKTSTSSGARPTLRPPGTHWAKFHPASVTAGVHHAGGDLRPRRRVLAETQGVEGPVGDRRLGMVGARAPQGPELATTDVDDTAARARVGEVSTFAERRGAIVEEEAPQELVRGHALDVQRLPNGSPFGVREGGEQRLAPRIAQPARGAADRLNDRDAVFGMTQP